MSFQVGQRVTQINDLPWRVRPGEIAPEYGKVYVIRDIISCGVFTGLTFNEIRNRCCDCGCGRDVCFFNAQDFRPVVERKTDISIFTRMLDPVRKPEPVG